VRRRLGLGERAALWVLYFLLTMAAIGLIVIGVYLWP
jgi:hypothetical protein